MGRQAKAKRERRGKRGAEKALRRSGVDGRLAALSALFQRAEFRARLNARFIEAESSDTPPQDLQDVRDLAFALAREEFGADTTDCMLTLDWHPHMGRKLDPHFHPTIEAVQRAEAEARARAAS
jgi:hypothetical protein